MSYEWGLPWLDAQRGEFKGPSYHTSRTASVTPVRLSRVMAVALNGPLRSAQEVLMFHYQGWVDGADETSARQAVRKETFQLVGSSLTGAWLGYVLHPDSDAPEGAAVCAFGSPICQVVLRAVGPGDPEFHLETLRALLGKARLSDGLTG